MYFSSSSSFSNSLVLVGIMVSKRRPLEDREIEIIQNLNKRLKLSVAHIAKAVGRNKTSEYKAVKLKHKTRRGERRRS